MKNKQEQTNTIIEWNKYIKWGKFTSTSGILLEFKWEFDRLNKEITDSNNILISIISLACPYDIVAIHSVNPKSLVKHCKAIYHPKTDVSNGFIDKKYVLYDDVITTGKSMLKAIEHYDKKPEKCICIVDRRLEAIPYIECNGWSLDLISIQDIINNKEVL